MNFVVDKADNLRVVESDSHFSEFTGIHPSKIKQGKLFLHDVIKPLYREEIMQILCKKNSPYVYFDTEFIDKNKNCVFVHCTGQNHEDSSLCRITAADVSNSRRKHLALKQKANEMTSLIDLVSGGVCLFEVTNDMHIEAKYLNEGGCRLFETSREMIENRSYRVDDFIYYEDKSDVFQAIGKAMATGEDVEMEFRITDSNGGFKWVKLDAGIQSYNDDNTPVFHGIFGDITNLKKTEEKVDELNDKLVSMFENLPGALFCTDGEDPFVLQLASADMIKLLGYPKEEIFNVRQGRIAEFIPKSEQKKAYEEIAKQIKSGQRAQVSYSIKTGDGKVVAVDDFRSLIKNSDGSVFTIGKIKKRA